MFAHSNGNRFWILEERGYAPEQAPGQAPPEGVLVDGAPLPSGKSQTGHGPGMKPGAGGKPQGYDSYGRYTGPRGGSVSLRDGSIRLYADADKQAGADSEAGRQEPKSLLSATAEQLNSIASGTGQAVTKGADGAKQALGRTWRELSTNQELHKGVEFGVKAAGEVSKDVGEQVSKHAATVYFGRKLGGDPDEPKWTTGVGPAPGLIWTGIKSYRDFPARGRSIGKRIQNIYDEVYGKREK